MLEILVESAWSLFSHVAEEDFVVKPSSPILFFGNSKAYQSSPLRIVSVGLNPSDREFPKVNPFMRFPGADEALHLGVNRETSRIYVDSLNAYFEQEPYRSWFNTFEPILNGLGASYYRGKCENTALHTDLCTPVATNPTWSHLTNAEQSLMEQMGGMLWHDLIGYLQPQVILISVARKRLEDIHFRLVRPWEKTYEVNELTRKNPYIVETATLEVSPGHQALAVFGRAAQKPFGTIDAKTKVELGQFIRRLVDGR